MDIISTVSDFKGSVAYLHIVSFTDINNNNNNNTLIVHSNFIKPKRKFFLPN